MIGVMLNYLMLNYLMLNCLMMMIPLYLMMLS